MAQIYKLDFLVLKLTIILKDELSCPEKLSSLLQAPSFGDTLMVIACS